MLQLTKKNHNKNSLIDLYAIIIIINIFQQGRQGLSIEMHLLSSFTSLRYMFVFLCLLLFIISHEKMIIRTIRLRIFV